MNFKEEYKKSADSISPDKEAIDRMKAAVLAEIAKEPEKSAAEARKPLPFKRIAIIGGAAAACAVITISAINLLPSINSTGSMVEEANGSSSVSMAEDTVSYSTTANDSGAKAQEISADLSSEEECSCATDDAAKTDIIESGAATAAAESVTAKPEAAEAFPSEPSAAGGQVNGIQTEQEEAQTLDAAVSAEIYYGTYECSDTATPDFSPQPDADADGKRPDTDVVMTASEPDMPDEANDAGREETVELAETAEATETYEVIDRGNPTTGGSPEEPCETTDSVETQECGEFSEEATSEASYEETYEAPSPEDSVPKLVLTGKGWLTYDGKRYNEDKEIKPEEMQELVITKSQNVMDKRFYYVNLDGDILMLYDENMDFVGAYRKR